MKMILAIIILSVLILSLSGVLVFKTIQGRNQEIYYIPQGGEEDEEQEPGDFVEFLEPSEASNTYDENVSIDEQQQPTARAISTGDIVITPDPKLSSPLLEQFEKYMIEGRSYLNPDLTLQTIASDMDTNRSYISKLVNDVYQTTLPVYLTELRIQYAKKYMEANPYANQDTIAANCGFKSAPNFNKKFKEITQLTPKQWIMICRNKQPKLKDQEYPSTT